MIRQTAMTATIAFLCAATPAAAQFQPSNAPGSHRVAATRSPLMPGQVPLGTSPLARQPQLNTQYPTVVPVRPFGYWGFRYPGVYGYSYGFGYGGYGTGPWVIREIVPQPVIVPVVVQPPTMPTRPLEAPSAALVSNVPPDHAVVNFQVPENAELWVEDQKMTDQKGKLRSFQTPALRPGQTYVYRVRVVWEQSGERKQWAKEITVRPGEEKSVLVLGQ